jgi:hypothetical protein
MIVYNTAKKVQSLGVIKNNQVKELLFQSAESKSGKIAPLSFAIYKLK